QLALDHTNPYEADEAAALNSKQVWVGVAWAMRHMGEAEAMS
nr:hypothetical protein [Tanacetum cinerariifolium]